MPVRMCAAALWHQGAYGVRFWEQFPDIPPERPAMNSLKEGVVPRVIDVLCPKCQHKVSEQRERLRADPHVTCPACHAVTSVDLTQLER